MSFISVLLFIIVLINFVLSLNIFTLVFTTASAAVCDKAYEIIFWHKTIILQLFVYELLT